jgi:hypothetical protein
LLSACTSKETVQYKTDVAVDDISTNIYENTKLDTLIEADNEWIAFNVPIDTSCCEDFSVYISANGESNLFGIFKATSEEKAETLYNQAESYLENMEKNWMSEYLPEELPKIQNAVAKRCGLYVSFIILEDELRVGAEKTFTEMLTK